MLVVKEKKGREKKERRREREGEKKKERERRERGRGRGEGGRGYGLTEGTGGEGTEGGGERNTLQSNLQGNENIKINSMDYFLEFILFILILGIACILASILLTHLLKIYYLILIVLGGVIFTTFVPTKFFVAPMNFLFNLEKLQKKNP